MFFILSKVAWFFLKPSNFLLIVALLGLVALARQHRRAGMGMMATSLILLTILAFSPVSRLGLQWLENRFPEQTLARVMKAYPDVAGVIVLGGAINAGPSRGRAFPVVNASGERLLEGVILARNLPSRTLLYSGGDIGLLNMTAIEAEHAGRIIAGLVGLADDEKEQKGLHLLLEKEARNTYENAVYTKAMLGKDADKTWLLVTSAFHMARSVGCFQKVGMTVIPYPVDYRAAPESPDLRVYTQASAGLKETDILAKEIVGLIVYYLTGKTAALIPAAA